MEAQDEQTVLEHVGEAGLAVPDRTYAQLSRTAGLRALTGGHFSSHLAAPELADGMFSRRAKRNFRSA